MNRFVFFAFVSVSALTIAGCAEKPCMDLVTRVCEKSPDSLACEAAGKLTVDDECKDYLDNIDKFIKLKNAVVTEEGVKPPAPVEKKASEPGAETEADAETEAGAETEADAKTEAVAGTKNEKADAPAEK